VTFPGLFPNDTALDTITVTINYILNPSPASTTSDFLCYVGDDYTLPSDNNSASVTLTAGNFKSCSVTFNPNIVNKTNSYMQISAIVQNDIPSAGSVIVTMPKTNYWYYDIGHQVFPISMNSLMLCSNTTTVIYLYNLECKPNYDMYWWHRQRV
jgi:hypothetical protein